MNYSYDALNRLTVMDYPGSPLDVSFTYNTYSGCSNGKGRVCRRVDGSGETVYSYDVRGNLLSQAVTIGSVVKSFAYEYDTVDRLKAITYPSGRKVEYRRDTLGQIDRVTLSKGAESHILADGLTYLPFGPLAGLEYGNGLEGVWTYDADYRLSSKTAGPNGTPASVQSLGYGYDQADNITSLTDGVDGNWSQSLGYDRVNRLTSATATGYGSLTYGYDGVGNRTGHTHGSTSEDYTYDYQDGSPESHRLTQVLAGSTPVAEYQYNGSGERVMKSVGAGESLYYYGPQGELLLEADETGEPLLEHVYVNGTLLASVDALALAGGGSTVPVPEFQVNTYTQNEQNVPAVAALDNGDYVVVWESDGQDGSAIGVYAQRYARGGTPLGSEFRVNVTTYAHQVKPAVAGLPDSEFVVVFKSGTSSTFALKGRRYDADGQALSGEFNIGSSPVSSDARPRVTRLTSGKFVIVWHKSTDVYFAIHNADGTVYKTETLTNSTTSGQQDFPAVSSLTGGGFVVVWQHEPAGTSPAQRDIYGRRYDASGNAIGGEFQISTTSPGGHGFPNVAGLSNGGFAAAWGHRISIGNYRTYARRFDSSGQGVGNDFEVDSFGGQAADRRHTITDTADDGFLVAWEAPANQKDVAGRYYDANGVGGSQFTVNDTTGNVQNHVDAVRLADGAIAIAWGSNLQDGSSVGVYAEELVPSGGTSGPALETAVKYVHTDHMGTPQAITDDTGTVIWSARYEPFGKTAAIDLDPDGDSTDFINNIRFPGQYFDAETGLHYNYFRDYHPSTGRYLQSDPIGLAGGTNLYAYAEQNPLTKFDPDGLLVRLFCRTVTQTRFLGPLRQSHCFVQVTCPDEGINVALSLFGNFPYFESWGLKVMTGWGEFNASPDNPNSLDNNYIRVIEPESNCGCAFEKDILRRFDAAPLSRDYYGLYYNSNTFAQDLITSQKFGTTLPPDVPANAPGFWGR